MKKKILFLQNKGNIYGGVWFVNKTLANGLAANNYDCRVVSLRNEPGKPIDIADANFKVDVINDEDLWEIVHFSDIISDIKKLSLIKAFKNAIKKISDEKKLKKDYSKLASYIKEYNPDRIICTHYQLLDAIPSSHLSKTIFEQHSSFQIIENHKATIKTLEKYKDKIAQFVWLTKSTCNDAINFGFKNSTYIYNPIRFSTNKVADVVSNKKLITISRLSEEKRIDLMLKIAKNVLNKFPDWSLELYGASTLDDGLMEVINSSNQIKLMGKTDNPSNELLNASIYLSTSYTEGFALSILEAYECGVPCVSYNFGESCIEQIIDGKTGYIVDFGKEDKFCDVLSNLMENKNTLIEMSKNSKEYAKKFGLQSIIKDWIELFDKI